MKPLFIFLIANISFSNTKILSDYKNRVDDSFKITKFFEPQVGFWYKIYTYYPSTVGVIHDKEKYGLIYGSSSKPEKFKKELTKKLKELGIKKRSYPNLLWKIKQYYKIPSKNRKAFFDKLIKKLRTQTGQKNFIRAGLERYSKYKYFLEKTIKRFKIPKELLAITFLESSFNNRARSKANAAGAWQFMPLIASYFLPKRNRYTDYRFNTVLSSLAAFQLLKQNIKILKRHDLAITAYNSGTKNLIKARRKYKEKATLEYIIKHHKGKTFGFASKNFYSEFLALTRVLAYKNEIFKKLPKDEKINYKVYLNKCRFRPYQTFKSAELKQENRQFLSRKKLYPKESIITTRKNLSKRYYQLVNEKHYLSSYPKSFHKRYKTKCK